MRRLLLAPLLAGLIMPAALAQDDVPAVTEATLADALSASTAGQVITPLRLHLEKHSPLQLVANLALPGQKLLLERDGKAIEIREQPAAVERFTLAEDGKAARYVVRLLAADGQELARESLNLQPATASLQLHVTANQVFGKKLSPLAATVGAGELSLLLDGQSIHQQNITQAGTLVLPALPLAPGRHRLQLELDTGGRKITSPAIQIFSFGIEPLDHDWLLADKYNFTLYWIRQGVLHRIYPVATGRPG
ncbi:MAG TPA: L,D-transpeptidase, partial [Candidatus Obscuribacterales bacterium]